MAGYWKDIIVDGVVIGREWAETGLPAPKNAYRLAQWVDVLTDAELDAILDLVNGDTGTQNQRRAARRVWEYWRVNDRVDFNLAKNVAVLTWLVANTGGVWTSARAAELIG